MVKVCPYKEVYESSQIFYGLLVEKSWSKKHVVKLVYERTFQFSENGNHQKGKDTSGYKRRIRVSIAVCFINICVGCSEIVFYILLLSSLTVWVVILFGGGLHRNDLPSKYCDKKSWRFMDLWWLLSPLTGEWGWVAFLLHLINSNNKGYILGLLLYFYGQGPRSKQLIYSGW